MTAVSLQTCLHNFGIDDFDLFASLLSWYLPWLGSNSHRRFPLLDSFCLSIVDILDSALLGTEFDKRKLSFLVWANSCSSATQFAEVGVPAAIARCFAVGPSESQFGMCVPLTGSNGSISLIPAPKY